MLPFHHVDLSGCYNYDTKEIPGKSEKGWRTVLVGSSSCTVTTAMGVFNSVLHPALILLTLILMFAAYR